VADRTVSARLRLDVAGFVGNAAVARAAIKGIADEANRTGRGTTTSFGQATGATQRLGEGLTTVGATARRAGADLEKASIATRRAMLAAADASEKAERSAADAAQAAERLARGEIQQAEASRITARAERDSERAAIAHAAASLRAGEETDKHTVSEQKLGRQLQTTTRGLTANRTTLVSLIAAGVGAGASITAAGAAFAGFAALAAPSIVRVVAAQQDLSANWVTLDRRQKVAAANVRGLIGDYKALAKSYEPEALAAFNTVVGTTRALLPRLGEVVNQTSGSVQEFVGRLAGFIDGPETAGFLSFAGANAPHALDLLGTTMTETGSLALNLVKDLAPMGFTLLSVTNGALGLVNGLAKANPMLAEMAVVGLTLRAPISAASGLVTKMTGGLKGLSGEAKGATLATKALNAISAVGPNIYLAAGAALVYLAARAATTRDATDRLIDAVRVENQAFGNNIRGHQLAAKALGELSVGYATYNKVLSLSNAERRKHAEDLDVQAFIKVKRAIDEENAAARRGAEGERYLAAAYGLTTTQANQLATAAGVDLSKGITGSGAAAVAARAKISAYRAAVEEARDPTRQISLAWEAAGNNALLLKDRTAALSAALDAYFNPSLSVYANTTKLRQAFLQAVDAINKSHGSLGLATEKSRAARDAFAALLAQTAQTAQSIYSFTSQTQGAAAASNAARASVERQLPVLLALAGKNADARAQVLALAQSFNATGSAANTSKAAFLAQAASMGIGKARAASLWKEFVQVRGQLAGVTSASHTASGALNVLSRERHLQMNIQAWQRALATAKANLKSVPASKRSQLLATISDLQRKIAQAKAQLASIHNKTVYIHGVVYYTQVGATPSHLGGRIMAEGGIYGPGLVKRYAAGDVERAVPATRDIGPVVTTRPIALFGEAGPEAYIPLSQSRRARSTMLLGEVADMFGYGLVRRMADGSMVRGTSVMAAAGGTGGGGTMVTSRHVLEVRSGGSRMDALLVEVLRKAVQDRGGNVQFVLGRSR
jgi:hypothetical protein